MDRFAAHYIFTGSKVLRKAVIAVDKQHLIVSLSKEDAMAIEYSNTIFFNGIICPKLVSYPQKIASSNFTILSTNRSIPPQYIKPDNLLISYNENEEKELFSLFNTMQIKFGYTIFDLLKIVSYNNYLAQGIQPPVLKVGSSVMLSLITRLDLVGNLFVPETRLKEL